MKDAVTVGEPTAVSRQEVFGDYVDCFLQLCTDVGPCHDERLLEKAAQYLNREPELQGTFTVFPFHLSVQSICRDTRGGRGDWRKFLSAVIKATEFLETLCVNILLQPWKKEIKTVKTFTGPFVYCLLPVFDSLTLQSVLASIGYLPNSDTPTSEFRLCEEVNLDKVKLLSFELMLARVECCHLLELRDRPPVQHQRWLEVLHQRLGSVKEEGSTEEKTTEGKEEEKSDDADGKEAPLQLDCRPSVTLQPGPLHCNVTPEDQSFIEMQMTYPDLAIRGRPLLPDKPQQVKGGNRGHIKAPQTANISRGNSVKASSGALCSQRGVSRADEEGDDGEPCSGWTDRSSSGTVAPKGITTSSPCSSEGSRDDNDHSRGSALHITLRSGSRAGLSLRPGQPVPPAEPPAWTPEQTATGSQQHPPVSPTDLKRDIRELEERMDELCLQDTKEEGMAKEENPRGGEKANKARRRRKERKASTEGKTAEQSLLTDTGTRPAVRGSTTASESDPTLMKQPGMCPSSPLTISTAADCQSGQETCKELQEGDRKSPETC